MSDLRFNKENFEKIKQRIIKIIDGVSEKETTEWRESKRILKDWDFFRLMDVCLLLLAPFNFRVSDTDIHKAVEAVGYRFMDKNLMAASLWKGTRRGKSYGWETCSSLDTHMNSHWFFAPTHSDEKKFFEWPKVKEYLKKFLTGKNDYDRDAFIMLKLKPDILKGVFQVTWWLGEELEKLEKIEKGEK